MIIVLITVPGVAGARRAKSLPGGRRILRMSITGGKPIQAITVLLVEDNPRDADLVFRALDDGAAASA